MSFAWIGRRQASHRRPPVRAWPPLCAYQRTKLARRCAAGDPANSRRGQTALNYGRHRRDPDRRRPGRRSRRAGRARIRPLPRPGLRRLPRRPRPRRRLDHRHCRRAACVRRRATRQHLGALCHRSLPPEWIASASASIATPGWSKSSRTSPHPASPSPGLCPVSPDLREAAAQWITTGAQRRAARDSQRPAAHLPPLDHRLRHAPRYLEHSGPGDARNRHATNPANPLRRLRPSRLTGLGNGGGFYDRTLATITPRPLAVGIAWSHSALPSIDPQSHDIPMDLIVTERAAIWHRPQAPRQPLTDAQQNGI